MIDFIDFLFNFVAVFFLFNLNKLYRCGEKNPAKLCCGDLFLSRFLIFFEGPSRFPLRLCSPLSVVIESRMPG